MTDDPVQAAATGALKEQPFPGPEIARPRERAHPGPAEYVRVAVALALVTAMEVAIYYIQELRPALVPMLLVLSAIKFALVAMWYMHLRFDSRFFSALFVGGLVLAMVLFFVVLLTFRVLLI